MVEVGRQLIEQSAELFKRNLEAAFLDIHVIEYFYRCNNVQDREGLFAVQEPGKLLALSLEFRRIDGVINVTHLLRYLHSVVGVVHDIAHHDEGHQKLCFLRCGDEAFLF